MDKWDKRFLGLAREVSSWSKDPSTKVGAVLADGKHVVSVGYNGFPSTCEDKQEWNDDRETKYRLVIHAEANAIANARGPVGGLTLYTYPLCPCRDCARLIAGHGIKRVVSQVDTDNPRFTPDDAKFVFECNGIDFEIVE